MDDREACSSSGNDQERLASIAGAFLSDNVRLVSKPFRNIWGRSKASKNRSALQPLRQSLADASALETRHHLDDRLDGSASFQLHQRKQLKHRFKPQVHFTLGHTVLCAVTCTFL